MQFCATINSMDKFRLEPMTLSSLDEVMEIEALAYGEHHWSRDSFVGELNNKVSSYTVATNKEGKCVGYLGMWKIIDEAHITNLAIHPNYRQMGVATLLMVDALRKCYGEKIKFLTLEVRASNKKAISLYEKFGFKSLGARKKYYQDNNEDALIMWSENIFDEKYKEIFNGLEKKAKELEL